MNDMNDMNLIQMGYRRCLKMVVMKRDVFMKKSHLSSLDVTDT